MLRVVVVNEKVEETAYAEASAVKVYPNPAKDEFTVEILNPPTGGQNDVLVLELYDVMGRLVRRFTVHSLPAGQAGLIFTNLPKQKERKRPNKRSF